MTRLEEIVEKLETGNTSMEEALKLYEEGMDLTKFCSGKLDEAETKIQILSKDDAGFELTDTEI